MPLTPWSAGNRARSARATLRLLLGLVLLALPAFRAAGEAMLQYFNTDYRELTRRIPELAEIGYDSLWLPPPTKGSGGLSVGYDLWDRFDFGSKDQRGSIRTRYGTEDELQRLIETAHRFGLRVYFDTIMNHNAFDVPGFNAFTPIDLYPGFLPEDFHLRVTEDGFYRKWDNTRDWGSSWQVQNLGLADLIDIAHETPNTNFGPSEGSSHPKITFVRHPGQTAYYLDTDLPLPVTNPRTGVTFSTFSFADKEVYQDVGYTPPGGGGPVGAGNGRFDFADLDGDGQHDAGEPSEPFADTGLDGDNPGRRTATWGYGNGRYDMGNPVPEDVGGILIRSVRYKMDRLRADGLRLDAVKHVPDYFFGQQSGAFKDESSAGYLGQAQEQFNLTRGFSDWNNHRDTNFDSERARDDALMFGEHLGQPPGYGGYWDAGMRLVDNDLRSALNGVLGNPSATLAGLDQPGWGGFAPGLGVMHAQSHDSDFAARRELQHFLYFTRAGIPLVYTDGNNQAQTLGQSGGAFPRHANTAFLGQWGDPRLPNVVYLHQHFARGDQRPRWSDADYVAYERHDRRETPAGQSMADADAVTMLFLLNDNFASGQARPVGTAFPSTPGGNDAYLFNYSTYGGGFYTWASNLGSTVVPPGGYFAFSYRTPEPSDVLAPSGAQPGTEPIRLLQDGQPVGTLTYARRDGRDGDPAFNPLGLPNRGFPAGTTPEPRTYLMTVPRVTAGTNLGFQVRTDGSAENILVRLNGGIDINSQMGLGPTGAGQDRRDHPPALSTDVFLGYEQARFVRRTAEKFAAASVARNVLGSTGAETYSLTIGTAGFGLASGSGYNSSSGTAAYVWHDPAATRDIDPVPQFAPAPAAAAGQPLTIRVKSGYQNQVSNGWVYYTTDGTTFPEGSGGIGRGTTQVAPLAFDRNGLPDGANVTDWWTATLPAQPAGTVLRYKIGLTRLNTPSVFPAGPDSVARKKRMETFFEVTGLDPTNLRYRPHNDYGPERTGLAEGFHVVRARAFLNRSGPGQPPRASLYNTFVQTFYYDAERPAGEIRFPATDGESVGGNGYGVVVRTDATVDEVWYRLVDADSSNDDAATGRLAGNGDGFEPFTDANQNGRYDAGEVFTDLDGDSAWDASGVEAWARASEVTPTTAIRSSFEREWRFTYGSIPFGNQPARILVRLRELSSAERPAFASTPTDAAGHFTTLERQVRTNGPDFTTLVAFPQSDLDSIPHPYIAKVWFSKTLADGIDPATLLARFSVTVGGNEASDLRTALPPSSFSINWNVSDRFHELAVPLPALFNGNPDYLHRLDVTHTRPDLVLTTSRLFRAQPSSVPQVVITSPPEVLSDGRPNEIVLPDVATPTAEQRLVGIEVATSLNVTSAPVMSFDSGTGTIVPDPDDAGRTDGGTRFWRFRWIDPVAGTVRIRATVPGNFDTRSITVVFRELLPAVPADPDDDDDGLLDTWENTITPLPTTNPETWTNGQVHQARAFGQSNPLSPDTDGDGLPDALEVGWRSILTTGETFTDSGYLVGTNLTGAANGRFDWTDTNGDGDHDGGEPSEPFGDANGNGRFDFGTIAARDTDGDGAPNFLPDLDPPFFNTLDNFDRVPNATSAAQGGDRAARVAGSTTNPNRADTDGDGLPDGVEDANRNGWVDGDGASIPPTFQPWLGRAWPNGRVDPNETWLETDPNNADTDGDGLQDGNGEDRNANGRIDGDANGNRRYDAGESWTETDPLNRDTDGDGLPDGWEQAYGLDPLDNGLDSLRTSTPGDGQPAQGADGDPDGDSFTNEQELLNGTDPRTADTPGQAPPAGSIVIGPQAPLTVGETVNRREFTDWTLDDLIALDPYEGDGPNNQGGDTFPAFDGHDSSRDLTAFYARDGGAPGAGGDGRLYFRADFHDLRALSEEGNLDLYVVIDTGNPAIGESALPDQIDTRTDLRWEAVVAVYQSNVGAVFIDTNPAINTTAINQDLVPAGVVRRDQSHPSGFGRAYFDSAFDAVEFSISRQALLDAGWNGDFSRLNFQVYTTRDGTQNSPRGLGDLGGRSDIRDSIRNNWIAEDYFFNQAGISGDNAILREWIGRQADNDRGRRAKVIALVHGNQAIQPGSTIQRLIHDGAGAGYHRAIDTHEAFGARLTLHITPTLASAIQWAAVDPAANRPWLDGPTLNARIGALAQAGQVELLGTTFSDHPLPYFSEAFNADNFALARDLLTRIYGVAPSARTVWTPERVADHRVLATLAAAGFRQTFVDQTRHFVEWFGRTAAYANDGYRINRVNGFDLLAIHDQASAFRFTTTDNGLGLRLRELLSRKARDGQQDQFVTLQSWWEDFGNKAQADAWERNVRWMAARPWIEFVTPDRVATGQVDLSQPPDGLGDTFGVADRGTGRTLNLNAHDWLDWATQESYDHWYFGQSGREQGLRSTVLNLRPGVPLPQPFGQQGVDGLADQAWDAVESLTAGPELAGLHRLARGTSHASVFLAGWHNQPTSDLRKFSTGAYINPDASYQTLAPFARQAASRMRFAATQAAVAQWAQAVTLGSFRTESVAEARDVDLDGEVEYLLYNDRIFGVFEALGGRLVGAWARDPETGEVFQGIGHPLAFPGTEDETEGTADVVAGQPGAFRTSGLQLRFAQTGPAATEGTAAYVNTRFNVLAAGTGPGWIFAAPDGQVLSTVTLGPRRTGFLATYRIGAPVRALRVRSGLSPNLDALLAQGQSGLGSVIDQAGEAGLSQTSGPSHQPRIVRAFLRHSGDGLTAGFNPLASDRDATVNWSTRPGRNQAHTHQVEASGPDGLSFVLGLQTGPTVTTDTDADGLPDWWERRYGLDPTLATGVNGAGGDLDGDGRDHRTEFGFRSDPSQPDRGPLAEVRRTAAGVELTFPTDLDRSYTIEYRSSLTSGAWVPTGILLAGTGAVRVWTDDGSATGGPVAPGQDRYYRVVALVPAY